MAACVRASIRGRSPGSAKKPGPCALTDENAASQKKTAGRPDLIVREVGEFMFNDLPL
jgi:hypothetical protein